MGNAERASGIALAQRQLHSAASDHQPPSWSCLSCCHVSYVGCYVSTVLKAEWPCQASCALDVS